MEGTRWASFCWCFSSRYCWADWGSRPTSCGSWLRWCSSPGWWVSVWRAAKVRAAGLAGTAGEPVSHSERKVGDMRNVWKGLVVGGLTGVGAGVILDSLVGASKKAAALGDQVREHAPDAGRWVQSVTDKAGDWLHD